MKEATRIELEALICEREAYLVENQSRQLCGCAPAYGEKDFLDLADRMRALMPSNKTGSRRCGCDHPNIQWNLAGDRWLCCFCGKEGEGKRKKGE